MTKTTPMFGRWLKRLRAHHDLTQEQLAEQAYCSVQAIRSFEAGKRRPSLEMAERLADVLQVPAEQRASFLREARMAIGAGEEEAPLPTPTAPAEAAPPPPPAPPIRLPSPPTALIGRQAEQTVIRELLRNGRLVTLVGPGGIGKTRLSVQVAHDLAATFTDGACFVTLSPVTSAAEIPAAIAQALGASLPGASDPAEQLTAMLGGRSLLLVLDNFEHLLTETNGAAAMALIEHIGQYSASVHLLITSRERLRTPGEHVFELAGLALPSPYAEVDQGDAMPEAVTLFFERARQMVHGFQLSGGESALVVRICTLLEGNPLAIELAATWVRTLTVEEIAEEVARNIDFLAITNRSAPARHRSLRAVFEHSWTLLTADERPILAKLAVFRGGFDRAAAQSVAGARLPALAALIDKSMVRSVSGADNGFRYDLHELLRQYLWEKLLDLGEEQALLGRHAGYYTALAERIAPQLYAPEAQQGQRLLESEQGNLRAALHWSLRANGDRALGLRLASALGRYWYLAGLWKEGRDWLQLAEKTPSDEGAARAGLLVALGELTYLLGNQGQAAVYLDEGLARWRQLGDPANLAWTLFQLGNLATMRGDYPQAERYFEESIAHYRAIGEQWGMATVLNQLGSVAVNQGDSRRAAVWLAESLPILRALKRQGGIAVTLNLLGRARLDEGESSEAIGLFQEALAILRQRQSRAGMAWSEVNLGLAYVSQGRSVEAAQHFRAALRIYQELESSSGLMAVFNGLAAVAATEERWTAAVQLLAAADRLQGENGQALTVFESEMMKRTRLQAQAALEEGRWPELWASGRHLSLEAANAVALEGKQVDR